MKIRAGDKEVDATFVEFKTKFIDNYPALTRVYFNKEQMKMLGLEEGDLVTVFFMKNNKTLLSYNFYVKAEEGGLKFIEIPALLTRALNLGTQHREALAFRTDYGLVFVLVRGDGDE